nr:hypothetical protein [Tanacetum cinerariifolium]
NHPNPNPTSQQPALHPIDVENYDASPNIILISNDDDEDDEEARKSYMASCVVRYGAFGNGKTSSSMRTQVRSLRF